MDTLLPCIIEKIILYLARLPRLCDDFTDYGVNLWPQATLRPLLALNRHWRHVTCMHYYQAASLVIMSSWLDLWQFQLAADLRDIVRLGCQQYVRRLHFLFRIDDVARTGFSETVQRVMSEAGNLPSVREIRYSCICPASYTLPEGQSRLSINGLAKVIKRALPQTRRTTLMFDHLCEMSRPVHTSLDDAVRSMLAAVNSPCALTLGFTEKYRAFFVSPAMLGLKHLHIHRRAAGRSITQIAKRNSDTLESLVLENIPLSNLASIFTGRKGRQVIYPELKKLVINRREYVDRHRCTLHLQTNPTPKLVELHCKGGYPFDGVQIITWNRQQLKTLELDLDVNLMKQLYKTGDLYAEAFPQLKALSLGWNSLDAVPQQRVKWIIFAMLFTLGCSVEYIETSLVMGRVYPDMMMDVCMDGIVVLDMRAISLTCLQAVRMFGRLCRLSRAHFSLSSCRQDGRWRPMTAGEICYYKSNCMESSSVHSLYVHNNVFQESQFVPAHVLSFALALPSLRFIFAPMQSRDMDIGTLIAQTRQCSLFEDEPQVNNVKLLSMY